MRQLNHTHSWSPGPPEPAFQALALLVTLAYPSAQSQNAAFRKSLTDPRDSRETTSCE